MLTIPEKSVHQAKWIILMADMRLQLRHQLAANSRGALVAQGEKAEIWPGVHGRAHRESVIDCVSSYPLIAPSIAALMSVYRFLLPPLEVEAGLRLRIEAALARTAHLAGSI